MPLGSHAPHRSGAARKHRDLDFFTQVPILEPKSLRW